MQLLQNHTELKGEPKMVPFGYLGKLCLHIDIYLLTFYFEIKKKKKSSQYVQQASHYQF